MVAPQTVAASSESERLNAFFQEVHEAAIARWPEWQTSLGLKTDYGLWNDRSEAKRIVELEIGIRNLSRLRHEFDYDKLDPDAKLSYRLFERGAERRIEWFPFRHHGYQVNHLGGVHKRVPSFLINHPCLSALRIHTLGVDCVRKMAGQSILHIVCVCINRIGTQPPSGE